ncbi:uncharacterized protein LOC129599274 isoform X1 [Paramacrobiotus metropolitanus]|uniref:uncharacterized protein LOC129599274 isoform X1 n=1 Tax=Paramacrobiotus metropolitanus TaxID=2943436 RepID=UPI002445F79A|nr:uncharacterized protein LOC129599274 isoform X1 [Paramacrobiotus metropolitanus]
MIKPIAILCVVLSAQSRAQQYVWDLLKPPLTAGEVRAIAFNAYAADTFPMYASIPQTNLRCDNKKQPGFYADTEAQCQVFHRCDVNGNQTSYLCVNSTVFNQVTLVCDYFYNVDCERLSLPGELYRDHPLDPMRILRLGH